MTKRILIFGDSITYGAWDKEGGWVERLKKFLYHRTFQGEGDADYEVYNLGIPIDESSKEVLRRFESETRARTLKAKNNTVIFAIGTNDSYISKNKARTPLKTFEKNVKKLIIVSKKLSSKVIFVGLMPADESKTNPVEWERDVNYKNESIEKYNDMLRIVCMKNKIYFIDVFDIWKESDYKHLLEDGLHPNTEGHQKLFETVKDYLTENKII
jgi:lysophospholipase L1-like esterase